MVDVKGRWAFITGASRGIGFGAALFIAKKGVLPAGIIYLLSFTAAFAGSYALNAVISRLPFFRWAVLGITTIKDDKNVS